MKIELNLARHDRKNVYKKYVMHENDEELTGFIQKQHRSKALNSFLRNM